MPGYAEAYRLIGGLSEPEKMPRYGYSLPANRCKLGGRLARKGLGICAKCYALKGHYAYRNVRDALERRFQIVSRALEDPEFRERYIDAFVFVLKRKMRTARTRDPYRFRWHDSGDIQSVEHLQMIAHIAERTRPVRHWLPTREIGMVREFARQHGIDHRTQRVLGYPNLCIRISAMDFDRPAVDSAIALS